MGVFACGRVSEPLYGKGDHRYSDRHGDDRVYAPEAGVNEHEAVQDRSERDGSACVQLDRRALAVAAFPR